MDAEAQLDLLFDLLHDLGKYIRMPLSLLPDSAGEQEVRNALLAQLETGPARETLDHLARAVAQGEGCEAAVQNLVRKQAIRASRLVYRSSQVLSVCCRATGGWQIARP